MVDLADGQEQQQLINQLESDVNEITFFLNEFNRFAEVHTGKSKLMESFLNDSSTDKLVEIDDDNPKTELEALLAEYTASYESFKRVFYIFIAKILFLYDLR